MANVSHSIVSTISSRLRSITIECVVDNIVPGQEEGNADLLESLGAGLRIGFPAELGPVIVSLLEDGGAKWLLMSEAARTHGRPGAAEAIANLAAELAVCPKLTHNTAQ